MLSIVLFSIVSTTSLVLCAPQVDFPINAQVPPVARVSQAYSYQFSSQTFSSSKSDQLQYSIQNAPAWIHLDGKTRTLDGTPGASDLGPVTLDLIADDGEGSTTLQATLVVVDTATPQASNATTALSQAGPLADEMTLSTRSGSPFKISFGQDTFSSVVNPLFYATSSDRSPLPSWVDFDPAALTFSGTTPPDMAAPQVYGLTLYISTIKGFSEASVSFGVSVGNHQLYFGLVVNEIDIPDNGTIAYTGLRDDLRLDGGPVQSQYLKSVSLDGPEWLSLDNDTFVLSGTAPNGTISQSINIIAKDTYGDTASSTLMLVAAQSPSSPQSQSQSFFAGLPSMINATTGEYFTYTVPKSAITIYDYISHLSLSSADTWLSYDTANLTMHGIVPNNTRASDVAADLVVTSISTNTSQTAIIQIHLQPSDNTAGGSSITTPSTSTTNNPKHLSTGAAAAIGVLCTLLGILLLLALAYAIYRTMTAKRHRKKKPRPWISRPIKPDSANRWLSYQADAPIEEGDGSVDDGSATSVAPSHLGPQFGHTRMHSDGSYLQPQDVDAITAINRTSMGTVAADAGHHPHDAMKLPTLMARLRKARAKSRRSKDFNKGSMWPGSLKLKRLRSLRGDSASYYPGDEEEFRSSTIHDDTLTQIDEDGTFIHKSHHHPTQSSVSYQTRSTRPTIPLRNVNRPSKPIRFVSVAPTLQDVPITDPTILINHPLEPDEAVSNGQDNWEAPTIYSQYTHSTLPSLPSPAKLHVDARPVTEKRASYIRHRAEARAEGNSRGNILFSAGGGLGSDIDRGRGSRLLAKLRRGSRSRSPQKRASRPMSNGAATGHAAKPSRSRSSSLGIRLGALTERTERTELSEMEAQVEEWATTAAGSPAHTNTTGPAIRYTEAPGFEDDDRSDVVDAEEQRRQSKRQRWRDKLNRDSKGQMGPGVREDALLTARIASGAGERPSKESVNFRTASWVREALGEGSGNSSGKLGGEAAKEVGKFGGREVSGYGGFSEDGDDGWRDHRAWGGGENVGAGKRFVSEATVESGTYAFL